jgi:hypothetical protein
MPETQRCALAKGAVELAPDFAAGWAWLGYLLASDASYGEGRKRTEPYASLRTSAQDALEKATRLDGTLALAHASASLLEPLAAYGRREALLDAAQARSPSDVVIMSQRAILLDSVGRLRAAMATARLAYGLDPLNPPSLGLCAVESLCMGSFAECLAISQEGRARWPNEMNLYLPAAHAAALMGDSAALAEITRLIGGAQIGAAAVWDRRSIEIAFAFYEALLRMDQAYAIRTLAAAKERLRRNGRLSLTTLSTISALGLRDEAFLLAEEASFDRVFEPGAWDITNGWAMGAFLSVHLNRAMIADRRFLRLCARIGLVGYWEVTNCWPDCADQVPYDFRAEARKIAAEGLAPHV